MSINAIGGGFNSVPVLGQLSGQISNARADWRSNRLAVHLANLSHAQNVERDAMAHERNRENIILGGVINMVGGELAHNNSLTLATHNAVLGERRAKSDFSRQTTLNTQQFGHATALADQSNVHSASMAAQANAHSTSMANLSNTHATAQANNNHSNAMQMQQQEHQNTFGNQSAFEAMTAASKMPRVDSMSLGKASVKRNQPKPRKPKAARPPGP